MHEARKRPFSAIFKKIAFPILRLTVLEANEYHTTKIRSSLLKDGVQDGRGFIIMTIQSTH